MRDSSDASPGRRPEPGSPSGGFWLRWRVVSLVLVALLALPAARQAYNWYDKSRAAEDAQAARDRARAYFAKLEADQKAAADAARAELEKATAAEQALAKGFQDAIANARKALEDKDFAVRLTGPARVQPGAPNRWQVETLDRHGRPITPKKLELVVKDAAGTELLKYTQEKPTAATASVTLPLSFWAKVTPGTELFLHVSALTADDRKGVLEERVPLSRPVYVTHLATDKPLYKPGETVRFRSLTLDRATLTPPAHDQCLRFRLRDPGDAVTQLDEGNGRLVANAQPVMGPDKKPLRGIGVGEYTIPTEAPGGEYKLDLYELDSGTGRELLLETRKFIVNRYVPDTFEKKLEFDGKSYGAGDTVQARIEVSRTAGGPMKGATALVVAAVDGREFHKQKDATFSIVPAERGATKAVLDVRFKLPADIFEKAAKDTPPSATLSLNIQDGSDAEPIVRLIPLVTKTLKVEFFPEGGEMIAGVPGRVYFMVKNQHGKPADLKGTITDGTKTVAEVATVTDAENPGVNRGHGIFELKPEAGKKYHLKITSPTGITEPSPEGFPLPEAKPDGVALQALDAVTRKGDAVHMRVQVGQGTKTLHIGAYARGRLIAHQKRDVTAGTPIDVHLKGDDNADGVTRVTVFEEPKGAAEGRAALVPKAERLVFRAAEQRLILNASPDKDRYTPAGKVRLTLSAFDEKEQPVPAVLMVGAVNRSVITMADNKTDRLMPTHFLLSGEVRHPAELEHTDFLLTDHKLAPAALDLLLGTQGWRRFAEQNPERVNPADRPDVDKMLVAHGQQTSAPFALYKLEEQRVASEFGPKIEQAALARQAAQDAWAARAADAEGPAKLVAAKTAATDADTKHTTAAAELHKYETRPEYPPTWGLSALVIALFALCVGGVPLVTARPGGGRRPFVLGTAALFALTGLTAAGVVRTWSTPEAETAWAKVNRDNRKNAATADEREMARAELPMMARGGAGAAPPRAAEPAFDRPVAAMAAAPQGLPAPAAPPGAFDPRPQADAKPGDDKDAAVKFDANKDGDKFAEAFKKAGAGRGEGKANERRRDQLGKALAAKPAPGGRPGRPVAPAGIPAAGAPFAGGALPGFPGGPGGFGGKGDFGNVQPPAIPFVVREYAHHRDPGLGEVRSDFTETVLWHPVLVLPESGKHAVEFQLSDDVARYQVLVAGHTLDGRIGAVTTTIEARQPFSVDPKLPLEISHTDVVDVPIRVTNDSDEKRKVSFALTPLGLKPEGALPDFLELAANGKGRKIVRLKADKLSGPAALGLVGKSGPDADSILRAITVVPDGFPGVGSVSDTIEKRATGTVKLPKDVVPGSLKVRLEVYPTSMADLVKGLDGLLREPGGCFEQTSTSNYPNTMILDYMTQTNQANPVAVKRAKEMLDRGYARLTSYECPDTPTKGRQGFEWFGGADRQHEALTAYGLLQFKDMARVHNVDPQLIKRTQQFLLSRRDGQGGFTRNPQALDRFGGAPDYTTNAYIVWALVESDPEDAEKLDLTKEIQKLKKDAENADSAAGKDAYFVALTANVLLMRGDRATAHALLDRLKTKHFKGGAVTGAQTSITRSGGRDLDIETTALTLLAWLRANDPKYGAATKDAIKWLSQQRGGYGAYGSTQSTILALKALTYYAKKSAHPSESGEIKLLVGGKEVAARKFGEKDVEVIGLDVANAEAVFKPGTSTEVEILTDAKQAYPFALSYTYTSLTPVSAEKCAVSVATRLAKAEANEGDTVSLHVTFENKLDKGHGMAVAVIGIPAGMKVPTDMKQLTDLREKGTIAYFETRGRELVLYWRSLAPKQKIELTVDLVCDVPGSYRGPASRGYLYYDADHKHWVEPLAVKVLPMADEK